MLATSRAFLVVCPTWSCSLESLVETMEVATRSRAALAVVAALLVLMPEASRAERYIVGDAARWTWGYNYTDWVIRKGPFFLKDSLGTVV
jgi:hypothetical protein